MRIDSAPGDIDSDVYVGTATNGIIGREELVARHLLAASGGEIKPAMNFLFLAIMDTTDSAYRLSVIKAMRHVHRLGHKAE